MQLRNAYPGLTDSQIQRIIDQRASLGIAPIPETARVNMEKMINHCMSNTPPESARRPYSCDECISLLYQHADADWNFTPDDLCNMIPACNIHDSDCVNTLEAALKAQNVAGNRSHKARVNYA